MALWLLISIQEHRRLLLGQSFDALFGWRCWCRCCRCHWCWTNNFIVCFDHGLVESLVSVGVVLRSAVETRERTEAGEEGGDEKRAGCGEIGVWGGEGAELVLYDALYEN